MQTTALQSTESPLGTSEVERLAALVQEFTREELLWTSGYLAGLAAMRGETAASAPVFSVPVARSAGWTVLYGSQTGHGRGVAESLADVLAAKTGLVSRAFEQIHAREHSLELQLPFLARVLPDTPVIPILMGDQSRGVAFGLGDSLAEAFGGRDVALVASSDLSHYQDAVTAQTMDRVVLDSLDAFDAERLMAALEREPHHACGGGPMVAVLRAARRMGATTGGVLKYADSGDVSGDKSSVVGYVSAAFGEPGA